jgi:hypothetical protein
MIKLFSLRQVSNEQALGSSIGSISWYAVTSGRLLNHYPLLETQHTNSQCNWSCETRGPSQPTKQRHHQQERQMRERYDKEGSTYHSVGGDGWSTILLLPLKNICLLLSRLQGQKWLRTRTMEWVWTRVKSKTIRSNVRSGNSYRHNSLTSLKSKVL